MGFSLKKKTATAQWEYEKEQQRAEFDKREVQTSLSRSRPIQDSTPLAYPPPAPHLSQKVPPNFGAPPTPEFLSGIAVCVLNAGRFERQESGSDVFDCVAVAAQFGVDLLHSYPGFKALTKTGAQILMRASSRNIRCRDPTQAPSHAADYLRRVTDAFPVIAVHNLKAMNARTNKGRWEVPQDRMFPPHHAAVIELNLNLVNRLVEARNSVRRQRNDQNAWERLHTLVFRIGVTIAHELCHVFTSYLLYNERQHTPKEVTYAAEYSSDTIGESGRFWESETFGGYVDMRQGSQIERVAIRHGTRTLSNVMIIPPSFCRTMLKRDFTMLPLADPDFLKQQDKSFVLHSHAWKVEKYDDIFAKFADDPRPKELPRHVLDELMDGKGIYHRLPSHRLRNWIVDCNTVIGGKANWSCTVKMQA